MGKWVNPMSLVPKKPPSKFPELPAEIHMMIADHLSGVDKRILRLTNRYFNELVPRTELSLSDVSVTTVLQSEEAWHRATRTLKRLEKRMYACTLCSMLRPRTRFADTMFWFVRYQPPVDPAQRFCIDCGLLPQGVDSRGEARPVDQISEAPYRERTVITILRKGHIIRAGRWRRDKAFDRRGTYSKIPRNPYLSLQAE